MILGDQRRFAIECEPDLPQCSPLGIRGHVRLWVDSLAIGDFEDDQLLDETLAVLERTPAIQVELQAEFAGKTSLEILDALYHPQFGLSQSKRGYLVCPDLGSAFDGIYMAHIDCGRHEELVWRRFEDRVVCVVALERGAYAEVVHRFASLIANVRAKLS